MLDPPHYSQNQLKILGFRVLEYGICTQLSLFWYAGNFTWVTGVGMHSPLSKLREMGQNAITENAVVGNLPLSLPGPNGV
jgi:hypothetical protein